MIVAFPGLFFYPFLIGNCSVTVSLRRFSSMMFRVEMKCIAEITRFNHEVVCVGKQTGKYI